MTGTQRRVRMFGALALVTAGWLASTALFPTAARASVFQVLGTLVMILCGAIMLFDSPTWPSRLGAGVVVAIYAVLGLQRAPEPLRLDYWLGGRAIGLDLAVAVVLLVLLVLSLAKRARDTDPEPRM